MSLWTKVRTVITLGRGVATGLPEARAIDNPIILFGEWFAAANRSGMLLPEAMTVATASGDGIPSARMMLLKAFDEEGFVFYTNYESRKAEDIAANPRAAIVFYWAILERQVRVEGTVKRITAEESDAYFQTRTRGSQIGTWASKQSSVLDKRATLEQRAHDYERKFKGKEIPLPTFWGGYRLTPHRIEFWQGRINRLHDRLLYTREGGKWKIERLYP